MMENVSSKNLSLTDMPPELISKQLRFADQSLLSRELSRGMYIASTVDFYESQCNKPITEHELKKYVKNNIVTFG